MTILSTAGETLARLEALAGALDNPRHRSMLQAFRRHWRGEVTGDLDAAMAELPDNSHFAVLGAVASGQPFEVNTAQAHRAIYQMMLDLKLNPGGAFSSERFAFADWGLIMEAVYSNVVYGRMLDNVGKYEPDGLYLFHLPMTMVCTFSPAGRMLGKRDYLAAPFSIEPADRSTIGRLTALC
jgi:hypothetical protein